MEPNNRAEIYNGSFDSTANAWTLQTHGEGKGAGSVKEGKYYLEVSAAGAQPYTVQLIQHNLLLEKGQWYEISFDAKASAERKLEVNVEQHEDPWASYLEETVNFDIGTTEKSYSFRFQMTAPTDTNSRLSFNAGSAAVNMTLDNVTLKKSIPQTLSPDRLPLVYLRYRLALCLA